MIFKLQHNLSGLCFNNVTFELQPEPQPAPQPEQPPEQQPEPQPEPQPELQHDHNSLYIFYGDVVQTAAVQTAAVCLGH